MVAPSLTPSRAVSQLYKPGWAMMLVAVAASVMPAAGFVLAESAANPTSATSPAPAQARLSKTTPPGGYFRYPLTVAAAPTAYFDWFEYAGHDAVFDKPLSPGEHRNPILAGFYPDPSTVRVGDTYYLVNSTFTYFPGIPVFESHDLVHWMQIGNVVDRPGEVNFDGLGVSRGIFAPTIRYHAGMFYVVTTSVDAGGNMLFVAKNPAGPWSDPIRLPVDGIDPSLFFDDDGKVYLLNNGPPVDQPHYNGHRAIWIQQLDLSSRKLVGPRKVLVNGGVNFAAHPAWIEGPHLYRHEGWYILMCAEGGTGPEHSEVVLRSRSPWGPFKAYEGNPILTQRDLSLDRVAPIANAGHADLVEAADGTWWAVFLATRPYGKTHYNTGRETFMLQVAWQKGWPTILPAGQAIPYAAPGLAGLAGLAGLSGAASVPTTGNFTWRDDFDATDLKQQWSFVRVPKQPWADLTHRPGWLTVHALKVSLADTQNMSFLARRQQHQSFDATTELELPADSHVVAGLAVFQNENSWYFLGVRRTGEVFLEKRSGSQTQMLVELLADTPVLPASHIKLKVTANGAEYSFYVSAGTETRWKPVKARDDGTFLSTDVAGGFVGTFIGPYARAE